MRTVAVCSDIHANLEAFEGVLDDATARGVDEVWCLGDIVGIGPDTLDCVDLVRERCAIVLAGNHDLIAIGVIPPRNPARLQEPRVRRTVEHLRESIEHRDWLESLPSEQRVGAIVLAHGCPSPFDAVRDYLGEQATAQELLDARPSASAVLVGHTHRAEAWFDGEPLPRQGDELEIGAGERVVLNPGPVGDPGTPATWMELGLDDAGRPTFARWHRA